MIGYRMKKPAQCSDELYEVMKACRQLDTEGKPTFAELANILRGILARTGRGYINLAESQVYLTPTTAEMHDFRDKESIAKS